MQEADVSYDNTDDSDFEYEYHDSQTETFLIDIDFSSVSGNDKSDNAGVPKSLAAYARKKRKLNRTRAAAASQQNSENNETNKQLDLQILDLQSPNPVVAYEGQIYSCKWVDLIGTNLFLSRSQEVVNHTPDLSTNEYDLLGTSRIKLVGHRSITTLHRNEQLRLSESSHDEIISASAGRDVINQVQQKSGIDLDKQEVFLKRLQRIKAARGERDDVRGLNSVT